MVPNESARTLIRLFCSLHLVETAHPLTDPWQNKQFRAHAHSLGSKTEIKTQASGGNRAFTLAKKADLTLLIDIITVLGRTE